MSGASTRVFDSGAGGPVVASEILGQLPCESFCHTGDTQRISGGPLVVGGPHSAGERRRTPLTAAVFWMVGRTVTAARNMRVWASGTDAAVVSDARERALSVVPGARHAGSGAAHRVLADYAESGDTSRRRLLELRRAYPAPIQEADVDILIPGHTHYLSSTGVIGFVTGEGVTLVSSAERTVKDIRRQLVRHGPYRDPDLPPPPCGFRAGGVPEAFHAPGGSSSSPAVVSTGAPGVPGAFAPARSSSLPASPLTASSLTALAVAR